MIKGLPAEEQVRVVAFVRRELSQPGPTESFQEASAEVFTEYRDLLAKLAH